MTRIIKVVGIFLLSFTTQTFAYEVPDKETNCIQDTIKAPNWTCNPNIDGEIRAIGIAKKSQNQFQEALLSGKVALIDQISIKVDTFFQTRKNNSDTVSQTTIEKVSKQFANGILMDTQILDRWIHPIHGELFLLLGIPNKYIESELIKFTKK